MALGNILRFWGAADYEADLRFYDHMYPAAHRVKRESDHWRTDRLSVGLHDNLAHTLLTIGHTRVGFEAAPPPEFRREVDRMALRVREAVQGLGTKHLTRVGLKAVVYADIGLSFEKLLEGFRPLSIPVSGRLAQLTSEKVTDLALVVNYDIEDLSVMFRAGPMERTQGLNLLDQTGDIETLFKALSENDEIAKFYSEVPDVFVYLEADIFQKRKLPLDAWTSFVDRAADYSVELFEGLKSILLEDVK